MRKCRGALGYVIMIAAFLLLAFLISDSIRVPTNRITYPELLKMIEKNEVDRVSIRGNQLIGRNKVSLVAVTPADCERVVYTRLNESYRRLAYYVARILRGTRPQDLPIERPSVFHTVVNRKTAQKLGIVVPRSLLARADEVIG